MKAKRTLMTCFLLLAVGGCGLTSNERIETMQAVVEQYQQQSEVLSSQVEIVRKAVVEMRAELDNPDIDPGTAAKIKADIDAAMETAEKVLTAKAEIDTKINAWKLKIDEAMETNATFGTELELWGEGLKAVGDIAPAPVGIWFNIAAAFIGAIGVGYARKKTKETKAAKSEKEESDRLLSGSLKASGDLLSDINTGTITNRASALASLQVSQERSGTREGIRAKLKTIT